MLGLRHYQGNAIDLWQGKIEDFYCNQLFLLSFSEKKPQASDFQNKYAAEKSVLQGGLYPYKKGALATVIREALDKGRMRHVGFWVLDNPASEASSKGPTLEDYVLSELKAAIDHAPLSTRHRFTVITRNADEYKIFQDSLFHVFPER